MAETPPFKTLSSEACAALADLNDARDRLGRAIAALKARYDLPQAPDAIREEIAAAVRGVLPLVKERELASRSDLDGLPPEQQRALLADTIVAPGARLGAAARKRVRRSARFFWSRALHRRQRPTRFDAAAVLILARAVECIAGQRFSYGHAHTRPWKHAPLSESERSGPAKGEMLDVLLAAYAAAQALVRLHLPSQSLLPAHAPGAEGVLTIIKKAQQPRFRKAAAESGIDLGNPESIFARANDLALMLGQS